MMKKNNKTCLCCQTKYTFCLNCSDFDNMPRWMAIFHDKNCKEIFNTITSYYDKTITKEQAKTILNNCDLSNKKMFNNKIQDAINEIYADDIVKENVIVLEQE